MIVARYETMGTPVADPEGGPFDIGYDDIRTGIMIFANGDDMADAYASDPESIRSLTVVAEQPTLGLDGLEW